MGETRIQDRGQAGTIDPAAFRGEAAGGAETIVGAVHARLAHDSAAKHVSGRATYIDDLRELDGTLHLYVAMSARAHARVLRLDVERVARAPGVVRVLTAADIPGENDCSPVFGDDPIFAAGEVQYAGQSLFAVAAETEAQARAAAALA